MGEAGVGPRDVPELLGTKGVLFLDEAGGFPKDVGWGDLRWHHATRRGAVGQWFHAGARRGLGWGDLDRFGGRDDRDRVATLLEC
jgi:hypothetical protein